METRRGTSLVELLVIMSACTTLLTLTGVLLHRAMRVEMLSRAHVSAERAAKRLSEQFRSDVHSASAAADKTTNAGGAFLHLTLEGRRVVKYSRTGHTIVRTESGREQPAWHEEFAFPEIQALAVERKAGPQRLLLTITTSPTEMPSPDGKSLSGVSFVPVSLCVEAVVGRDLKFAAPPAIEEARP